MHPVSFNRQAGGTLLGIIIGILAGLGLALAVALYISKAPSPFIEKVPHRSPEQDAADAERNKNWNPNAPLGSKMPVRTVPDAAAGAASEPVAAASKPAKPASAAGATPAASAVAAGAKPKRDAAAILEGRDGGVTAAPAGVKDAKGAQTDPAGQAGAPQDRVADPYIYFVQTGAFVNPDDAERQRAQLALAGLTAKTTEREQAGRTLYRVRLGPFNTREQAEANQERARGAGTSADLVRVERTMAR